VDVHTVPPARIAQQRPVLNDFARARERALGDIRATLARALREHCDGALDLAYIPTSTGMPWRANVIRPGA